ncbi:hypothetical protein GGS26DRAFT_593502 [Hypomontagnella submonticulosa]|nr:hypothetical protein GGS26DRAFT_593502 [Hypomontagnella submonticulosa]
MGDQVQHHRMNQAKGIEDPILASIYGALTFADNVQNSLDGIKDNSKPLFWWTSTLVCICLGLFLLAQLIRLRRELAAIGQYQELFRRMWEEDREIKQARVEEKRRERQLFEQNRRAQAATRGRGALGASSGGTRARPPAPEQYNYQKASVRGEAGSPQFGPQGDAAFGAAPPPGPERDANLSYMVKGLRQLHVQGQDGEEGYGIRGINEGVRV